MHITHGTAGRRNAAIMRASIPLLALLACTCTAPYKVQVDSLHKEFGLRSLPVQSDFPGDDAVILVENTELELPDFNSTSKAQLKRYRKAIRVFRPSERFTTVTLGFPVTSQVTSISARTITSAGDVVELSHDEFHRYAHTSEAGGPKSGLCTITFAFRSVDSGAVLEYQYQMLSHAPMPVRRWNMQYEIPAMRLRYSFQIPALLVASQQEGGLKVPIGFRTFNHETDVQPVERRVDESTMEYVFEAVNVPAYRPLSSLASAAAARKYTLIRFGEFEKWEEVGTWYYERYFKPQLQQSGEVQVEASRLTRETETKIERAAALYDFVRSMRYVQIGFGEAGLLPSLPEDVLARKYGDCKDKSILLVSLLASVGIEAHPALVLTRDEGTVDEEWPAMTFNHMIVRACVDHGRWIWLDPTARFHPVDCLPWQCQSTHSLIVGCEDDSGLIVTPSSAGRSNAADTHTDVWIEGDSIVYDIRCRLLGEGCAEFRSRLSTMLRSEYIEVFRDMLHDDLSTAVLRRFYTQMEVGDTSMSVEMRLVESRTGSLQDGLLFIPAVPIDITDVTRWAVAEQRSQPVFLRYRRSIRDTVVVSFDNRIYSVLSKPTSTRSKVRSAVTFECRNMSLTGEHRVMADLECEKREIPAEEYEAFRRNVLGAVHARRGYVVVKYL